MCSVCEQEYGRCGSVCNRGKETLHKGRTDVLFLLFKIALTLPLRKHSHFSSHDDHGNLLIYLAI
jgi:hypothetical protein